MFSDKARAATQDTVTKIAAVVHKTGITPNAITVIGCSFMFLIGAIISQGFLATGGLLIIFAGAFDALDGALARHTGTVTRFGGFLDSVTDRYSEFAIFAGVLHYLIASEYPVLPSIYLILLALFGSIMVSYNRARAEGLDFECKGGWFSRFERLVVLVAGLFFTCVFGDNSILVAMGILAVFTNITAVQRILLVKESDDAAIAAAAAGSTSAGGKTTAKKA